METGGSHDAVGPLDSVCRLPCPGAAVVPLPWSGAAFCPLSWPGAAVWPLPWPVPPVWPLFDGASVSGVTLEGFSSPFSGDGAVVGYTFPEASSIT